MDSIEPMTTQVVTNVENAVAIDTILADAPPQAADYEKKVHQPTLLSQEPVVAIMSKRQQKKALRKAARLAKRAAMSRASASVLSYSGLAGATDTTQQPRGKEEAGNSKTNKNKKQKTREWKTTDDMSSSATATATATGAAAGAGVESSHAVHRSQGHVHGDPLKRNHPVLVQGTNDSSIVSKRSMARLGYVDDRFLRAFVRRPSRRSPLINRGYYIRAKAIDTIVARFLAAPSPSPEVAVNVGACEGHGDNPKIANDMISPPPSLLLSSPPPPSSAQQQPRQIVSLGAGFDTLYFRLQAAGALGPDDTVFELDFPPLVARKLALMAQDSELTTLLGQRIGPAAFQKSQKTNTTTTTPTKTTAAAAAAAELSAAADSGTAAARGAAAAACDPDSTSGAATDADADVLGGGACWRQYRLVGSDLTNLEHVTRRLHNAGLDLSRPTLFLSECVLTYVGAEDTSAVLEWCARACEHAVFVTYEQIRPNTVFGRVMQRHFTKLGSALKAINKYPSERAHRKRFRDLGWPRVQTCTMGSFWSRELDAEERARVHALEPFDEYEAWVLKCSHYLLVVASRGCMADTALLLAPQDEGILDASGAHGHGHGHGRGYEREQGKRQRQEQEQTDEVGMVQEGWTSGVGTASTIVATTNTVTATATATATAATEKTTSTTPPNAAEIVDLNSSSLEKQCLRMATAPLRDARVQRWGHAVAASTTSNPISAAANAKSGARAFALLFGGYGGTSHTRLEDTWVLSMQQATSTRTRTPACVPSAFSSSASPSPSTAAATVGGDSAAAAGAGAGCTIDSSETNGSDMLTTTSATSSWQWQRVETCGKSPGPRVYHTAVLATTQLGGQELWVYGGRASPAKPYSSLCALDLATHTWRVLDAGDVSATGSQPQKQRRKEQQRRKEGQQQPQKSHQEEEPAATSLQCHAGEHPGARWRHASACIDATLFDDHWEGESVKDSSSVSSSFATCAITESRAPANIPAADTSAADIPATTAVSAATTAATTTYPKSNPHASGNAMAVFGGRTHGHGGTGAGAGAGAGGSVVDNRLYVWKPHKLVSSKDGVVPATSEEGEGRWLAYDLDPDVVPARHSHTLTSWGTHRLLVTGGISNDMVPLPGLTVLTCTRNSTASKDSSVGADDSSCAGVGANAEKGGSGVHWKATRLELTPELPGRFAHAAALVGGGCGGSTPVTREQEQQQQEQQQQQQQQQLVIVGGACGTYLDVSATCVVVDLVNLVWRTVQIESVPGTGALLVSHALFPGPSPPPTQPSSFSSSSSTFSPSSGISSTVNQQQLVVCGGGANCFSFGTHFDPALAVFEGLLSTGDARRLENTNNNNEKVNNSSSLTYSAAAPAALLTTTTATTSASASSPAGSAHASSTCIAPSASTTTTTASSAAPPPGSSAAPPPGTTINTAAIIDDGATHYNKNSETFSTFALQSPPLALAPIQRIECGEMTPARWAALYKSERPFIVSNCKFGDSVRAWSDPNHLAAAAGDKDVSVHVTPQASMSFVKRNFRFQVMPFADLVDRVFGTAAAAAGGGGGDKCNNEGQKKQELLYYLRSMGENMRKEASNLERSFPGLARQFSLPDFVPPSVTTPSRDLFSTALRVSSAGVRLWTHYDTMDNVLCHIVGKKRVTLWAPESAHLLYLRGTTSEVIEEWETREEEEEEENAGEEEEAMERVGATTTKTTAAQSSATAAAAAATAAAKAELRRRFPLYNQAPKTTVTLGPGDMLHIPALWLHSVEAQSACVSVNVFWRGLERACYDKKDVYGNHDPLPAQRVDAVAEESIVGQLKTLPRRYRHFYTRRLIQRLEAALLL